MDFQPCDLDSCILDYDLLFDKQLHSHKLQGKDQHIWSSHKSYPWHNLMPRYILGDNLVLKDFQRNRAGIHIQPDLFVLCICYLDRMEKDCKDPIPL